MKRTKQKRDLVEPDCVIGFSFGTSTDSDSVNTKLSAMMLNLADGRPLIADRTLTDAMLNGDAQMTYVIDGDPTHGAGQGLNTWGTWVEAQKYMKRNKLSHPLVIAQAYHAPRVVKQGARLGVSSIVPKGLPTDFDKSSKQFWTRSVFLWLPINALGSFLLKLRNQL